MRRNLETADRIVKLVLSVTTVILFFAGVIAGPFARVLVVLSFGVITIFVVRLLSARPKHRNDFRAEKNSGGKGVDGN